MPPIFNAVPKTPWPPVAKFIGGSTEPTIGAADIAAGSPPPTHTTHLLSGRDPGASNAQLGGGIVGGLTLGILLFFVIITCCHSRSPPSSPSTSRSPSPPPSTRSTRNPLPPPKPVVVKVTKNTGVRDDGESQEGKIKKPEYAWTRRKAPRPGERADWHPPPAQRQSRSGRLETVELPPAAGTVLGYIA